MPYQNNNNRLVPKKVGLTSIDPKARVVGAGGITNFPVDKSAAYRTQAAIQAIASIGKGINDLNSYMKETAQDNAALLIEKDEQIKNNKHDWAVAASKQEGLAKFNPYIKDDYKSLAFNDLAAKSISDLLATQNLETLTPQEFNDLVTAQRGQLLQWAKDNNLSARVIGNGLVSYQNQLNQIKGKQLAANAKYQYDVALAKQVETGITNATNIIYDITGAERTTALSSYFNNFYSGLLEQGFAPKDCLLAMYSATTNLIKNVATDENTDFDFTSLLNAIKTSAGVGEININTLKPNWEYELRQTYKNAKLEQFQELKQDYAIKEFQKQQNIDKGQDTFLKWFNQNPTASPLEIKDKILEVSQEAPELMLKLTSTMVNYTNDIQALDTMQSNPDVLNYLTAHTVIGDLTQDMIIDSFNALSRKDALTFLGYYHKQEEAAYQAEHRAEAAQQKIEKDNLAKVEAQEKAAKKEFGTYVQRLDKQLQGKIPNDNLVKKLRTLHLSNDVQSAYNDIINNINQDIETYSGGLIKLKKLMERVDTAYNRYQQIQQDNENDNRLTGNWKPTDLLSLQQRKQMAVPLIQEYNDKAAQRAFELSGMFDKGTNINITSTVQKLRTFDNRPHQAYDIGLKEGTAIRVPKGVTYARIVASGYQEALGNYTLVQLGRNGEGGYIRLAHLSHRLPVGTELKQDGLIARSGNTGFSTGAHLDIEFWDSDLTRPKRLLASDFFARLNNKTNVKNSLKETRGFNH